MRKENFESKNGQNGRNGNDELNSHERHEGNARERLEEDESVIEEKKRMHAHGEEIGDNDISDKFMKRKLYTPISTPPLIIISKTDKSSNKINPEEKVRSKTKTIMALGMYVVSSILVTTMNKTVTNLVGDSMICFVIGYQMGISFMVVLTLRLLGVIPKGNIQIKSVIRWLPVIMWLILMTYTSMNSLRRLPVSIYTIFKNMTVILVFLGDKIFYTPRYNWQMLLSFVFIIIGPIISSINDVSTFSGGYIWIFVYCVSSSAYVHTLKSTICKVQFSDTDAALCSLGVGSPCFLLISYFVDDWRFFLNTYFSPTMIDTPQTKWMCFVITMSAFSTFLVSYGYSLAVRMASGTTFCMVNALSKLPITVSGILLFKEDRERMTIYNIVGIVISLFSGLLYAYGVIIVTKKKRREEMILPTDNRHIVEMLNTNNGQAFPPSPVLKTTLN